MFRFVRTTTLAALHDDLERARQALETARQDRDQARAEAAAATDSAIRAETAVEHQQHRLDRAHTERGRAEGELDALRAQVLLDTEDRAALRALLRATRKQQPADRVWVLFHHGHLHSIHATNEAAEAAAEAEGASPAGWTSHRPGAALPPAAEVAWRVQPLPLGGAG
ncbi:hypothetical protein BJP40_05980 [Streptomyces sp. CC53]|uniref:hypothetical protein n=1 Tax=Streptomyces sp. CC53 TaxID=1906740 RepID=UPI0008DDD8C6|nr:hypothetical protein [Streptomyces sp. CC53]OII61319.1 hypothetical protein BJP40_05980 [Streptomyces sp. CC53]